MYDHLKFAEVRRFESADYDELIAQASKQFQFEQRTMILADVTLTDEGSLRCNGTEAVMTKMAFLGLCKRLRIPDPFAQYIPWELLKHNIEAIAAEKKTVGQFFFRDDGVLAHIAPDKFLPVPYDVYIEAIREKAPKIRRGFLSDLGMEIDVTEPEFNLEGRFGTIEPIKGDVFESGINFKTSTVGYYHSVARLFVLRLVCTNGMVMPVKIGYAKLRMKEGRKIDIAVNNFLNQIKRMAVDSDILTGQLTGLNRSLNTLEFSRVFKGLDKIVRDRDFLDDTIFEVDQETRQNYLTQARLVKKDPSEESQETSVDGYDVVNNITFHAKQFEDEVRQQMEGFAGKIVTNQVAEA